MDIKKELQRIEKKLYFKKIPLNNIELLRLTEFGRELVGSKILYKLTK